MSSLFWAVFDDKQKKKTEEILATFDKDSKDEMGLMSITIALSSKMFPGTSVLHTRLRYIFLVGWIFLEALKSKKELSRELLNKKEKELRRILQINKENNQDLYLGILGSTKTIDDDGNGAELSQPPFNVYFNLLKEWGVILDKSLSVDELSRDSFCEKYLFILDDNFKNDTFILTTEEVDYIKLKVPKSILWTIFNKIQLEKEHFVNFDISEIVDEDQQSLFLKAQNFSLLMWGAMLYYNYYLGNEDGVTKKFDIWLSGIYKVLQTDWKPSDTLEEIDNVSKAQEAFIENWFKYIQENIDKLSLKNPPKINKKEVEEFLKEREVGLKGNRARLLPEQKAEFKNSEALEAKFGINPIQYRWSNIVRFKKDLGNATN